MKQSLKQIRSRKGRKQTEEQSSSDKDSDISREALLHDAKKAKRKEPEASKIKKKRKIESERAGVPSPPAAKKRKKRNLTKTGSDLANDNQSSGSNSSQEDSPLLSIPENFNNHITNSSAFIQYLKVII